MSRCQIGWNKKDFHPHYYLLLSKTCRFINTWQLAIVYPISTCVASNHEFIAPCSLFPPAESIICRMWRLRWLQVHQCRPFIGPKDEDRVPFHSNQTRNYHDNWGICVSWIRLRIWWEPENDWKQCCYRNTFTYISSLRPSSQVFLGVQEPNGISLLGIESQPLVNNTYASIPGQGSQMNFTKLLTDGSEVIDLTGDIRFIWAVGNDHSLTGHAIRGSIVLSLAPCQNNIDANAKRARDYNTALQLHGIAGASAFGLLVR